MGTIILSSTSVHCLKMSIERKMEIMVQKTNSGVQHWGETVVLILDKTPRFPARGKGVGFQEQRLHMLLLCAQLCWTLCDPKDCSLPGSFVHGISQTRILELPVFLLQGIFPAQGWNPCLLHLLPWQVDSLPLVPPRNPKISHAGQPKKKKVFS